MNYIDVVTDVIDYIENNSKQKFGLDELAERYSLSRFYFSRLFRSVTHRTLKTYLEERRLVRAAQMLRHTRCKIIDVAFEFDYQSHEAFSRQFRKFFGVSPSQYRKMRVSEQAFEKPVIVDRHFKNVNHNIIVSYNVVDVPAFQIWGRSCQFNPDNPSELWEAHRFVNDFVAEFVDESTSYLYGVVNSEVADSQICYFSGCEFANPGTSSNLHILQVPASSYAVFEYHGDMRDIFEVVMDDICRCIFVAGLEIRKIGIDFYEKYEAEYASTQKFQIYVPVT